MLWKVWSVISLVYPAFALHNHHAQWVLTGYDPCAKIAGKAWVLPREVRACLSAFPVDPVVKANLVEVVNKTLDFHTSANYQIQAHCNNAKKFFTTIAYQLCVNNETFAQAIGDVMKTVHGSAATMKNPHDQLQALILDPLRSIVRLSSFRPILIVVDALDECDEEDAFSVLTGLSQLIQDLLPFRVILTTRPKPYFDRFWVSQDGHKCFHLRDIEDIVVDSDVRHYLNHNLSMEQVQKCHSMRQWCASDEEIDSLVCAAGRFFIIASTAVRYILDKRASNPAAQMQKLLRRLRAFAQDHTPFKDLDRFYTVILWDVVPEDCGDSNVVSCYQSIVGTIILVHHQGLPVSTLAHLIDIDVEEIYVILDKLQFVISLGADDVPRVYITSLLEYLMDQSRCKDPHLRIEPRIRHTQIATRCFEIMDKHLKRNILGLGDLAQFRSNEDGITDEQLQEKIPQQLYYACVHWANHIELANIEDEALMNGLERFADERMLYWLEILSLIGKLDSARRAIDVVLKLLTSTSSDLHQLLSDALHFISKFYEIIERSALHTYYSALSFTPTDSLLYRRYNKEAEPICTIESGPEKWDALIANLSHGERINVVKFSVDSTLLVSCSEEHEDNGIRNQGKSRIWDAVTGIPISTVPGDKCAVANDFSAIASSQDNIATLCNVNGSPSGTIFTTSSKIQQLALSSESNRVAAALSNGTVWLWNSENAELVDKFDGFDYRLPQTRLQFSSTGTRLAYSSANGIVKLRDGISGRFITDLQCGLWSPVEFSGDGSRIASVSFNNSLTVWNSESGGLIAVVGDLGMNGLAISADEFLLANANRDKNKVTLWSENPAQTKVLMVDGLRSMAFSLDNILAIGTISDIKHYNVKTDSFIHTLSLGGYPAALAFSPDSTRLAVWNYNGNVNLWDIRDADASGSDDGSIKLWNGKDGLLCGTLKVSSGLGVSKLALSNSMLVAIEVDGVTLWSLYTLGLIHTFPESSYGTPTAVSIVENNALMAVAHRGGVSLLDTENYRTITTFDVDRIHAMTFLPDNLQLVALSKDGVFLTFNLINKHVMKGATLEHHIQLPNVSLWHGVPI